MFARLFIAVNMYILSGNICVTTNCFVLFVYDKTVAYIFMDKYINYFQIIFHTAYVLIHFSDSLTTLEYIMSNGRSIVDNELKVI
jgi:hypothetical protein